LVLGLAQARQMLAERLLLFIQLAAPKIPDRWRPYLPEIAAA